MIQYRARQKKEADAEMIYKLGLVVWNSRPHGPNKPGASAIRVVPKKRPKDQRPGKAY
jgi:hypothetical protein